MSSRIENRAALDKATAQYFAKIVPDAAAEERGMQDALSASEKFDFDESVGE